MQYQAFECMASTAWASPLFYIMIFAEGCMPGVKAAFLASNDRKFAWVVTRPFVKQIYSDTVCSVLGVSMVPEVVLAEEVIEGM